MDNPNSRPTVSPTYRLPLLVGLALLALIVIILSITVLTKSAEEVVQGDASGGGAGIAVGEPSPSAISRNDYRSSFKYGNFTFAIPEGAVTRQTDSGGQSVVSVYKDEATAYQAEGIVYSMLITASAEFETGESYSFEDWLERRDITLTKSEITIGGLEFAEGKHDDDGSTALYHYEAATAERPAYVLTLPAVNQDDTVSMFIQDSLNFSPTQAELEAAKSAG